MPKFDSEKPVEGTLPPREVASQSLAEYYIENRGREGISTASLSIYKRAGTYPELVDGWRNYFKNEGKDVTIDTDPDLGLIVTFSDNSNIGLVLPQNFEFGQALRSGNYDTDKQRGEMDPSALPIVLQSAKAQKQSGKWLVTQKGRLTHQ